MKNASSENEVCRPQTITDDYLEQQKALHLNPNYGVASKVFAPLVAMILQSNMISEISDYGAGKKNLLLALEQLGVDIKSYYPYDPVFPEYGSPQPAPLVCCIDVLEHVEPCCLEAVLQELQTIITDYGFITIHQGPAAKILPDGRNAHLIQASSSWWLEKIVRYFEVIHLEQHNLMGPGLWMIVSPRLLNRPGLASPD